MNPKDYLGRFYLDSLIHDETMLKYVVDLIGEDHVALGSDYPFPLGEHEPGKLIRTSSFGTEIEAKLLGINGLNWLGLSPDRFK